LNKCICCKRVDIENEKVRLNRDNGFCQSSCSEDICKDCLMKGSKITEFGYFLKVNDELFCDQYGWGAFNQIHSKRDIDKIFNREYYEVLEMLS
jgi:hypothetical protein